MTEFVQVTKDQFYEVINPLEHFSFRSERKETLALIDGHKVIGKCNPGYSNRDEHGRYTEEKRFFLTLEYAARIKRRAQ